MHQLQGNKEYGSEKKGYLLKKSDGYVQASLVSPCALAHFLSISHLWTFSHLSHRKAHLEFSHALSLYCEHTGFPRVRLRFNLLSLEEAVIVFWSLRDTYEL